MKRGMIYDQGDVVLIPFPYSDLSANQLRPALIISNSLINKTEDRICCLISRNSRKGDIQVKREDFKTGTLPFISFVRSHRLFTIHQAIIKKKLCTINESFHDKIISRINEYTKKI